MSTIDSTSETDIVKPSGPVPAASDSAASAPATQGETPADTSKEVPADAPGGERFQKSEYQRLQRQRGNAERRALRAEGQLSALEQRLKALEAASTQKSADLRPSDFPNYDAFVEAKIDRTVEAKTEEKLRANLGTSADREAAQAANDAWSAITADEEAEAAGVDLEAVFDTLRRQPFFPQQIFDLVAEADHPARLAQYLAKHPSELDRVSRMGPKLAEETLAEMQASLPKLKSKPSATSAPPPVPTVGGRGASQVDLEKIDDMAEYKAHWNARRFGPNK